MIWTLFDSSLTIVPTGYAIFTFKAISSGKFVICLYSSVKRHSLAPEVVHNVGDGAFLFEMEQFPQECEVCEATGMLITFCFP